MPRQERRIVTLQRHAVKFNASGSEPDGWEGIGALEGEVLPVVKRHTHFAFGAKREAPSVVRNRLSRD